MLNARMLSMLSFDSIFREHIDRQLIKIVEGKTLKNEEFDDQLKQELVKIENDDKVYMMEVVVGKGNNSREQFSLERPILRTAKDILSTDYRCSWYTMYNDAVIFAVFNRDQKEDYQLGAMNQDQAAQPPVLLVQSNSD